LDPANSDRPRRRWLAVFAVRSKLSASDISYPAEILDWERLRERNNSQMLAAPELISGVFRKRQGQ
jgi:hypothetical protein